MISAAPGPDTLAALVGPDWADAVRRVPREHFIPDAAEASPMTADPSRWIDRTADPGGWRDAVYSDTTILTQIADGSIALAPGVRGLPSSSSTAPSLVAAFLELLDPYPGDRVLEIGTGTGWTAGLLSARLGDGSVTTVEVDESVAERAAENLKRAGYAPHLIVGDGAGGAPANAPFDRVHVTCAVREIPHAWVEQTRPGGVIALPWAPMQVWAHKSVLIATGDGRAVGRFHGDTSFMMLRSQRPTPPDTRGHAPREGTGRVDPMRMTRADRGLEIALVGLLPGVVVGGLGRGDDRVGAWDPATGSYALAVREENGSGAEVTEYGPRRLWRDVEDAYLAWVRLGAPGRDRLGLLLDRQGQHVWLDRPDDLIGEV